MLLLLFVTDGNVFLLRVLTALSFFTLLVIPSPVSLDHSPWTRPCCLPASPDENVRHEQPRTTVSPIDIPFADEMNDSFDLHDGGGGGGTHVIIRDVKMTINDQEIVLNRSDGLVDPITAARIQTKPPYIEERHPKFRVIDSHN